MNKTKYPLTDPIRLSDGHADIQISTDNDIRTFSGVANSGQPFYYYGRRTVIDFENIQFKDKLPILIDHDRAQRAAVGNLAVMDKGLIISGTLLSNTHGTQVAQEADEGFPWEMSIDVRPSSVEELSEGQTVVVNGLSVVGPIQIFKNNTVREVSFTATGVDSNTSAVILADTINQQSNPEHKNMTLEEAIAEIKRLKAEKAQADADKETAETEKAKIQQKLEELESKAKKAEVDAKLAEAGFKRGEDQNWAGLSAVTYGLLLSAKAEDVTALLADIKPKTETPTAPAGLFTETTVPATTEGAQLADNALIIDAKQRSEKGNNYV